MSVCSICSCKGCKVLTWTRSTAGTHSFSVHISLFCAVVSNTSISESSGSSCQLYSLHLILTRDYSLRFTRTLCLLLMSSNITAKWFSSSGTGHLSCHRLHCYSVTLLQWCNGQESVCLSNYGNLNWVWSCCLAKPETVKVGGHDVMMGTQSMASVSICKKWWTNIQFEKGIIK